MSSPSSWIGKPMMNPKGLIGKVVNDDNDVGGGRVRILTVKFKDGKEEQLILSNVGRNPSESQKWKWLFEKGTMGKKEDEWVEWGEM